MQIHHISAECFPVAKVGGLADVVGALPKYQKQLGHDVKVFVPKYDTKFVQNNTFDIIFVGSVKFGVHYYPFSVHVDKSQQLGFELHLISIPGLFDRPNVYSYDDDTERFFAFQLAYLNWVKFSGIHLPDVVHCHDHHTGFIPFMMKHTFMFNFLRNTPSILTIHNAQYQGWMSKGLVHYFPEFYASDFGMLEWGGVLNALASAIKCSWRFSTVSTSYLEEIKYKANGLENLIHAESYKARGILNGIDVDVWDPATDSTLPYHFTAKTVKKDKFKNKAHLCQIFGLDPEKPLFAFIGRLVPDKGADILAEISFKALENYKQNLNIIMLGSGNNQVQNQFETVKHYYPKNFANFTGYDESLAHLIYASADFLLMPSRVEPCGLNQMYAMRYGTIPIVRRTGGLKDTVLDIGDSGFGICHDQTSVSDVLHAIYRALKLYEDTAYKNRVVQFIMDLDHSWEKVAEEYINLYKF